MNSHKSKSVESQPQHTPAPFPVPWSILDPDFKYYPAAATDVQRTWRKYGWVPPNERFDESGS